MSILVDNSDGICTITFKRPDKKNALTVQMYSDIVAAMKEAAANPKTRVVLFTGSGEHFTSGNDVFDFMSTPPTGEDSPVFQFLLTLIDYEKPIAVAVNGLAIGVGITMLLHCDLVYIASDAKLMMPFVSLALCPEASSTFLLPAMTGHAKAAELLLFGEPFDGQTAVDVGIAAKALPGAEVKAYARARCLALAAKPAASVRLTKRLMKQPFREQVKKALYDEAVEFAGRLGSDEAREAFSAFAEKRKPDFSSFD